MIGCLTPTASVTRRTSGDQESYPNQGSSKEDISKGCNFCAEDGRSSQEAGREEDHQDRVGTDDGGQDELPTKQVVAFFDLLAQTSAEHTKKIGEFTIPGIGKLVKAQRAARMGRNPATGEAIKIKAKTTLKFRIAKPMKDAVLQAGK